MGLLDFLNKPIACLNKPQPKTKEDRLKEAIARSKDYAQKGDKGNALNALLAYKNLGWDDSNFVMETALAYYYAGRSARAVEFNKRAIELSPEYGRPYINMGRAYFELKDYASAVSSYAKAMQLIEEKPQSNHKEDHPVACAWYGASLAMTGKKEEGEAFIKKAEEEGYQKGDGLREAVGLPVGGTVKKAAAEPETTDESQTGTLMIAKYGNGSEELVGELEHRLGVELEEEYYSFLIKYNGGNTPRTQVRCRSFSSDLRYLYGINTIKDIEEHVRKLIWLDRHYLPIGEDSFGNYYVIAGAGENWGCVFFCDHENGFATEKIADFFGEFVGMCSSEGIDPGAKVSPEEVIL